MLARIALLSLTTAFSLAGASERPQTIEQRAKRPELLEFLGPSNLLHFKLDLLDLAAPLESLIAPAFQVGLLDGLEKFVRLLLETLTGLDEINKNDSDFFKDLDATSSLIQMLESVHRTAKADNAQTNWNVTISKLLDDMESEIEQLPEKNRKNATVMINELREASEEKDTLQKVSETMLERTSSTLADQLLRVGNPFGTRAVSHISRLGGAGIFQMIHDDISSILGDPRIQSAPREILDQMGEIGSLAATQRDNMGVNRSFPFSMFESWNRFLSLPLEVLRVLDRSRSELLANLFATAAGRLNVLGITLPTRPATSREDQNKPPIYPRSFRNPYSKMTAASDLTNLLGTKLSLVSKSAELLQHSADALANTLLAPVSILLNPIIGLGKDSDRYSGQAQASADSSNPLSDTAVSN